MRNVKFVLLLFVGVAGSSWASSVDICDLIELPNCYGVSKQSRRTSMSSLPSPSTSASSNPAAVSFDRGFGIEAVHQSGNPVLFSVASGSGKVGGALISTNLENGFFGNRVVELDGVYVHRNLRKKQYRSQKITLALGAKLIRRNNSGLDIGILLKRHNEIGKINPGLGLSARLGPVSLGASIYQDDFYLRHSDFLKYPTFTTYDIYVQDRDYEERFTVQTASLGIRIKNVSLDSGLIKTQYRLFTRDSFAQVISGSYSHKNILFNLAHRTDNSEALKYMDKQLVYDRSQQHWYTGVQVSLGKHFIIGVGYNYFLLREFSLNSSIFF